VFGFKVFDLLGEGLFEFLFLFEIIFEVGVLHVQDHEHVLLELLRKHPRIDDVFYEWDPKKEAEEKYNLEEAILDAKIAVRNLSIDRKKSILRLFREGLAYKTEKMSVDEINYEVMKTAEMDPIGVIESIDDPESSLDDLAARAIRDGFVSVRNGGRDVHYNEKDNKKKAFTVPFEEQPVSALAAWLQTDGGKDFYQRLLNHYEE
jgi:hypothetical protein